MLLRSLLLINVLAIICGSQCVAKGSGEAGNETLISESAEQVYNRIIELDNNKEQKPPALTPENADVIGTINYNSNDLSVYLDKAKTTIFVTWTVVGNKYYSDGYKDVVDMLRPFTVKQAWKEFSISRKSSYVNQTTTVLVGLVDAHPKLQPVRNERELLQKRFDKLCRAVLHKPVEPKCKYKIYSDAEYKFFVVVTPKGVMRSQDDDLKIQSAIKQIAESKQTNGSVCINTQYSSK